MSFTFCKYGVYSSSFTLEAILMMESERLIPVPSFCESAAILSGEIEEILEIIPGDFSGRQYLEQRFEQLQEEILSTAPDKIPMIRAKARKVLDDFFLADSPVGMIAYVLLLAVRHD